MPLFSTNVLHGNRSMWQSAHVPKGDKGKNDQVHKYLVQLSMHVRSKARTRPVVRYICTKQEPKAWGVELYRGSGCNLAWSLHNWNQHPHKHDKENFPETSNSCIKVKTYLEWYPFLCTWLNSVIKYMRNVEGFLSNSCWKFFIVNHVNMQTLFWNYLHSVVFNLRTLLKVKVTQFLHRKNWLMCTLNWNANF